MGERKRGKQSAGLPDLPGDARKKRARPNVVDLERNYLRALVSSEFRPVFGMVALTISVGTVFYSLVEKWPVLDSLYFSVVTLATIGFGDITPVTRIGKIFTIAYVFVGVGTLGLFLSTVARFSVRGAQIGVQTFDEIDEDDAVEVD